jgi:hypothetical protein
MIRFFNRFIKLKTPDSRQTSLAEYFKGIRWKTDLPNEVVLVQCVEDEYYFGLFGRIISSLRDTQAIRVEQYVVRCLNVGESNSFFSFLKARLIYNPLLCVKWERLFGSFCDGVAFRGTDFLPIKDTVDFYRAWKIWRGLASKDLLLELQVDGVLVGDLVNDSFLRYKPAPTVDLKDCYTLILLWQAHRYVRRSRDYFSRVKPKLYLTSYSTYIHHGIPVRVALQSRIRVFAFGNLQEFTKELTLDDWVHTKNPDHYIADFFKHDRQVEKLALAEDALSTRLSGGVDSATAYMKKSAYAESGESVPDVSGAVIVFLHDFYDSPHVYRDILFSDFWEWVCFTIETLKRSNIRFFLKPHPNQINLSDEVMKELKKCYPDLLLVSSGVTNKQLAAAGISCAVTVYGTVAHEMAYLGVPSIACARHPHVNFDFCRTAYSREDYAALLQHPELSLIEKAAMHRQSLIFYYMHNLALSKEMLEIRSNLASFRSTCWDIDNQQDLLRPLQEMSMKPGYHALVSQMIS